MRKKIEALKNIFHRSNVKNKTEKSKFTTSDSFINTKEIKNKKNFLSGIFKDNKNGSNSKINEESTISGMTDIYEKNKEYNSETILSVIDNPSSSFLQKIPSLDEISTNKDIKTTKMSEDDLASLNEVGDEDEDNFSDIFSNIKANQEIINEEKLKYKSSQTKIDYMNMSLKELIEYDQCEIDDDYYNLNSMDFPKPKNLKEYNRENWLVSKLVKYLKTGNTTATYIALAMLRDLDLNRDAVLYSLINSNVILILVNLLSTNDIKCQCGSMKIIKELSTNKMMSFEIVKEGGIIPLIKILNELDNDAKCLSAECLANLSMLKIARTMIRKQDGIHRLIKILAFSHLKIQKSNYTKRISKSNENFNLKSCQNESFKNYELMKSVALALYTQSKDEINHYIMLKNGIIIILTNLIKTISNEKAIYWLIALLENCSLTDAYVVAILNEDLVNPLIKRLNETTDYSLKSFIVGIFSKCAQDLKFCNILKAKNCFPLIFKLTEEALQKLPLISSSNRPPPSAIKGRSEVPKSLIKQVAYTSDNNEKPSEKLISNVTSTLAKCCLHNPNLVEFLAESKILEKLVHILDYYQSQFDYKVYYSDNTIINITKAISVWANSVENRKKLLNSNGIRIFINLLKINNDEIIINVCHILGLCSLEKECLDRIHKLEGIRLIWSLLRNNNPKVQESACWLLYVCIERIVNFGELVRNLTGGIELLLNLLDNDHTTVLAYACATISKVAIDADNLAIMSDYKLIEKLIKLCLKYYNSEKKDFLLLKMFLAEAISKCSINIKNSIKLGESGIIRLLVKHLVAKNVRHKIKKTPVNFNYCPLASNSIQINDFEIHGSIIKVLKELSNNTINCHLMLQDGIIIFLIESIGSTNVEIQENSATCLKNIRKAIN